MLLTVDEAAERVCPRSSRDTGAGTGSCRAAGCLAWRWREPALDDPPRPDAYRVKTSPKGSWGLAGVSLVLS